MMLLIISEKNVVKCVYKFINLIIFLFLKILKKRKNYKKKKNVTSVIRM